MTHSPPPHCGGGRGRGEKEGEGGGEGEEGREKRKEGGREDTREKPGSVLVIYKPLGS